MELRYIRNKNLTDKGKQTFEYKTNWNKNTWVCVL